jgi:PAS domain S-box-containing protein
MTDGATGSDEISRLRECLNDVASIVALPASTDEPLQFVGSLSAALLGILRLAFVVVRFNDPEGGPSGEVMHVAEPLDAERTGFSLAGARLGFQDHIGIIVTGCPRQDFPTDTEQLVLEVVANRATTALQKAHVAVEQRRAAATLREAEHESRLANERNLQLTIDTIPALVWRGTPDGELDYLNQRAVAFLGHTAETLRGGGWLELVHPGHRDATVRRWLHSVTTGAPYEDVYQLRRSDGEYRWIQSIGERLHGADGRIAHWYGVVIDIEDRKRAEVELRRAYNSFADAQRLSKTGSFITDLIGDDHNWSDEAYRIFDFDPATKVTVQRVRDVIHPDDRSSFESVISRAMTGVNVTFAFRILTASGALKHVRGVAHIIERIEGRPMFIGALQDVTESVVAQEALNQAGAELEHVSRATTLSALTASIAHEVNQPLSGILTNAGTCLRMLDAAPPNIDGARETARRTIRDGNRAADVIARLRALFGKRDFTPEPLDLNDAVREVIALASTDLQRNRVIVRSELAGDLPIVAGDRIQLQQVILNLLRNASDAMVDVHDRPRHLLIKTEPDNDDRVRLTVRDAGVGLPSRSADSLFDAFHTTKSGGMGIGLFVSRSIIERHLGRLWAEPNEGPGASFSFSIPRGPAGVSATPHALRFS